MTTDDYPHIRRQFATQWQIDSRRYVPERDDITAAKRAHDERLEAALTKARNEDAATRKRTGGTLSDHVNRAARERDARRDRRQGFEGDDAITHDLLNRADADAADIGQVKDETVNELARRLNAQFPSESGAFNPKSSAHQLALTMAAQRRGRSVGVGNA
jgi:hypothetical protein